jgi:Coenzyme PQQ synthesis protein D (PqqD)
VELESVIARNDELPSAPIDDEIVFLNAAIDSYVALDEIGRRIWDLLERPQPIADLVSELEMEYSGSSDTIASDVIAFLEELEGEGMVRVLGTLG